MADWTLRPEPLLQGYCVEWAEPGEVLLSCRNALFRATASRPPFESLAQVHAPLWKRVTTRLRLATRALRFAFYNVLVLADGAILVSFARQLGLFRKGKYVPLEGMRGPCRVLRGGMALLPDGTAYFGEYFANLDRTEDVLLYRCPPGSHRVEVAHRFEPGAIRHIHGVFYDPYEGCLWCTAGDMAGECRIMRSDDGFRSLDVVGAGDETWRTVSLQLSADSIYYGSDAEFIQNHIYRIDRKTGRREVLTAVDGPVYYSHAAGGDRFFGVTAELCPSQKGRAAQLWHVSPQHTCELLASFEKDRYSKHYFLPGTIYFPRGPGLKDEFFLHTVAVRSADNMTFRAQRNPLAKCESKADQ